MFGMGGSEILVILIVALLFLGPDKLPQAAKQISKGIRDIKKQSRVLQKTIEDDEHIGGAIRDLKSALRGEDEPVRPKPIKPRKQLPEAAEPVIDPALAPPGTPEHGASPDTPVGEAVIEANGATIKPASDVDKSWDDTGEKPKLTMPQTAGEPDPDVPVGSPNDGDLAAMVKPAPGTIAQTRPDAPAPPVVPSESEPKHG